MCVDWVLVVGLCRGGGLGCGLIGVGVGIGVRWGGGRGMVGGGDRCICRFRCVVGVGGGEVGFEGGVCGREDGGGGRCGVLGGGGGRGGCC